MTRFIGSRSTRSGSNPAYDMSGPDDQTTRPSWLIRAPRLTLIGWGIVLILGLYLIRLWQLQFLEGGAWRARAEQQQTRLETISPPRGVVYDRNGEILVRNVPAYNVTITPGLLPDDVDREREVLLRLSNLIDIPYSTTEGLDLPKYRTETFAAGRSLTPPFGEEPSPGLLEIVNRVRWLEPFAPIVVEQNIDRELALIIAQESNVTLQGVGIQVIPQRRYIYGSLTAQLLGFLGPIPPERVEEMENKGYNTSFDRIGYAGVEAQYEEQLRGTPGRRVVEKDVLGQVLNVLNETAPNPGDNLYLTIDLSLQSVVEDALQQGLENANSRRGVVIVLDPRNGELLSMVSLPTFDNNLFSGRLDEQAYEDILKDPHHPFQNHAIADVIPPGSTFKIVPATAALQEGIINRYTTINDPGFIMLPNKFAPDDPTLAQKFYCWYNLQYGGGHGSLNIVDALAQSCDVFFYEIGGGFEETNVDGLGVDRLAAYAREFGLGHETGLDIPGEAAGLVPTPLWKRQRYQETWTTGNTYNMTIGQGDVLVTPLQMANAMAVVANGGVLFTPQIVHHIEDADHNTIKSWTPIISSTLEIDEAVWQIVREGLDLAVSESGTGSRALLDDLEINVAGKTGTAEYCDDIALKAGRCDVAEGQTLPTHAWFMAYAPEEAPEIVALAWVYDGGEGSVVAAPIVHDVMQFYFRRSRGLLGDEAPEDPDTTP